MLVAGLVVLDGLALQRVLGDGERDPPLGTDGRRRPLERAERRPCVSSGAVGQHRERLVVDGGRRIEPALGVGERPSQERLDVIVAERPQLVDLGAGQQRRVDLEEGVLGGGSDQRHEAVLDGGKQRVLLCLVEAVDLVEEKDGPPPGPSPLLSAAEHRPDLGSTGVDGGLLLKGAIGGGRDDPRNRRLAGSRWPVEDHRVRLARLDRRAQRGALREQMLLPGEVGERARPHPHRQRRVGAAFGAWPALTAFEETVGHRRITTRPHTRCIEAIWTPAPFS